MQRTNCFSRKEASQHLELFIASDKGIPHIKKIFLFLALLIIACGQAETTCNTKGIAKRVNFSMPSNVKISTNSAIPVGSTLYIELMGIGGPAPVFTCDNSSENGYTAVTTTSEASGVAGITGKSVYEAGIPDIGYQTSDLLTGSIYGMIPVVTGSIPVPGAAEDTLYHYQLVRTETIDLSQSPTNSNVPFYVADNDYKATTPSSLLLPINMKFVSLVPHENSYGITSTETVNLSGTDKVALLSTSPGGKTSKGRSFALNINCGQKSTGDTAYYWFNPRLGTDGTPGVLLNSDPTSSGDVQNVNTITEENGIPVNFYNYEAKSLVVDTSKPSREINLTADHYRIAGDIITDAIKGLLEVVAQEE